MIATNGTLFVIQIHDDADVAFAAWARNSESFYPRPQCLKTSGTTSAGDLSRSDLVLAGD
jgi:hypothetical protein